MDFSAPRKRRLGAPQLQSQLSRLTDRTRLRRLKATLLAKGAWQLVTRIEDLCHAQVSHKWLYYLDACVGSVYDLATGYSVPSSCVDGGRLLSERTADVDEITSTQPMHIPAAKAAVEKGWQKLEKISAWDLTKVRSKSEVIDEARTEGRKVHFASLTDICHLKNAELEAKHQKYKGRVVLRGDIVK